MKQSVVKELSTNELREKITDELATLAKLRLTHSITPLENPLKIGNSRKTIARLKTELKRRSKADSSTK